MKYVILLFVVVLISCSETKIGTEDVVFKVSEKEQNDTINETTIIHDSLYVHLNVLEQEKLDSIKKLAFTNLDNPFMNSESKKWVKGNITFKGTKYDAQIKFHGTSIKHYQDNKYSYSVKWEDSLGLNFIKLIKSEEAFPAIAAINQIALNNKLISSSGSMRIGIINGLNKGVYYLVEPLKHNNVKRNFKHEKFTILSHFSDWSRKERNGKFPSHWSKNDLFTGHIENNENPLFPKALHHYKLLSEDIIKKNIGNLKAKVDIDYMGNYLALALIFNDVHFMSGDNLKLLYDFEQDKFYPLFRIESEGIPFESFLDTNFIELNRFLFHSQGEHYSKAPFLQFFALLISDTEFRIKRDKYLYHFLNNKESIIREIENIHYNNSAVMNLIEEDKRYIHLNRAKRQKHIVKTAFSLISKYLNYAHIYCTYDKSKKQLSFNADSFCPIDVYYNDKLLLANHSGINFTEDLKLIQSNKELKIGVNHFNEKKVMFINSITKDTIKQHVYVNFIDSN